MLIMSADGAPSSSGRVASDVEGGAGTRHAVYIKPEDISWGLVDPSALLSSAAGHVTSAEDEDDLEDWVRRRTVVAGTTDWAEEEEDERRGSAQPAPIMQAVQEQLVFSLSGLFSPR
jgi:hypothetical protein